MTTETLEQPATAFLTYCEALSASLAECVVTDQFEQRMLFEQAETASLKLFCTVRSQRGKVMLVGNGGSAAIVSHMHNDLSKCDGIRAMVFNEAPLLTAWTNDVGYEVAFEEQVRHWAEPRDMLVAVSSSGQSENIIRAATAAQEAGIKVVTFSGFSPNNTLRQIGDINYYLPSREYGTVELAHSILCHYITDMLAMEE